MSRLPPGQRPIISQPLSTEPSRSASSDISYGRPGPSTQPLRLPRGGRESETSLPYAQPYANGFPSSSNAPLDRSSSMAPPPSSSTTARPSRPARSERRPVSGSPSASPRASQVAFDGTASANGFGDYDIAKPSSSAPRMDERPSLQSKLQRALDANKQRGERPTSSASFASEWLPARGRAAALGWWTSIRRQTRRHQRRIPSCSCCSGSIDEQVDGHCHVGLLGRWSTTAAITKWIHRPLHRGEHVEVPKAPKASRCG